MLQETKMPKMENFLAQQFWGNTEVIWSAKNAVGRLGGMLLLWNPVLFEA